MRYAHGLVALLAVLFVVGAADAQGFLVLSPYGPPAPLGRVGTFGGGVVLGGRHHHGRLEFLLGGSVTRYYGGYFGGYGYPYPFGYGQANTFVSIIAPPAPPPPTQIVVVQAPPPPQPEPEVFVEIGPRPMPPPAEDRPLPGEQAGRFRPIPPGDRERAQKPAPPAEEPRPPRPAERPPADEPRPRRPGERPPPELPPPPQPEADPRAEHARLIRLGKELFARGEYGWAAHRFRQAVALGPGDADGQFLLAQALFAQGRYTEAVDAIHAGMRLRPDWPTAPFRPIDLYGEAADYTDHLRNLEDALTASPNDPVLLFLTAYQLWFDGREEDAVKLFQRAARVAADRSFSDRFLRAARPAGNGVL
jgi:hypothetical protein